MKIWEPYLTDRDIAVYEAAGYGASLPLGQRPAVLIVDVNYDFVGDERAPILASIDRWPNSCGSEGWDAVGHIGVLLDAARTIRTPIFYTTTFEPRPDGLGSGLWRSSRKGESAPVSDVVGSDIVQEIAPMESDVLIRKSKPSAFFGTDLLSLLLELRIDSLLIFGTTTSGCVRASVVDAFSYNFRVAVVEECTFDRGQASHAMSLFDMDAKYAEVISLERALSYIGDIREAGSAD